MPLRPLLREQAWLLPPNLDDLLPQGHPARLVAAFVESLDDAALPGWSSLQQGAVEGAPAYHPVALLGVWLLGFMTGVRSSRKLEAACRDQVSYLWLTGWQRPDHSTLWRFYRANRQGMRKLLKQTVRMAVTMGLLDLAIQAVDGTKVVGNAAKRWTLDREQLHRLLRQTDRAIRDLEAQNESGDDPPPPSLPDELKQAQQLRERVRAAMQALEDEGQERTNLTDGDTRLMKGRHGIVAGYNAQAMVSPLQGCPGMMITAAEVVTEANDTQQLAPMRELAAETAGEQAAVTLADAGYHSGAALEACANVGHSTVMPEPQKAALQRPYHKDRFAYDASTDRFTCPQGQVLRFTRTKHTRGTLMRLYRASGKVCRHCPAFGLCTKDRRHGRGLEVGPHDAALRHHRAWMTTAAAQTLYRRRQGLVEPVFGIMKEQQAARRFHLRGLANVRAEWALLAAAFNLRVLARLLSRPARSMCMG